MSPTARTLAYLRELGFAVIERVEQQVPGTFIKRDFMGCADLIAFGHPNAGIVAIQVTSGSNHAARRQKALREPRLEAWLRDGGRFQVVSWRQAAPRKPWAVRVEEINLQDITEGRVA
jgi:hypothetical protein